MEIRALRTDDARPLGAFFLEVADDAETRRYFHPHPLTVEYAVDLCVRVPTMKDRYYLAVVGGRVAGYSMLRGMDEGFAVPSFGACTHPGVRDVGLGQAILAHAIEESRHIGAPKLRLTVYKENARAIRVYQKLGFEFTDKDDHSLLGILDLSQPVAPVIRPLNEEKLATWAARRRRCA